MELCENPPCEGQVMLENAERLSSLPSTQDLQTLCPAVPYTRRALSLCPQSLLL